MAVPESTPLGLPKQRHGNAANTKRRSYTLDYKLSVVEWIQEHKASLRSASKEFGVDRKMLRSWMNDKLNLLAARSRHGPGKKKLHNGRPPRSVELDRLVLDHLTQLRKEGESVCDRALQNRALEYAKTLGLSDFKAASTWLKRWKDRHSVTISANGSNDLRSKDISHSRDPSQLSHVRSCDVVDVSHAAGLSNVQSEIWDEDGPVHYDFATPEHCYCKKQQHSTRTNSYPSFIMDHSSTAFHLGGDVLAGNLGQEGRHFHTDYTTPHFDSFPAAPSTLISCIPELEFTLDHEEIVGGLANSDSNVFMLQHDARSAGLESQFPALADCLLGSRQQVENRAVSGDYLELPFLPAKKQSESQKKVKTRNAHKKTKRAKEKNPMTSFSMLDDPQGPSGLLASRLSQPVFPAELEIIFFDHDLHTSPH